MAKIQETYYMIRRKERDGSWRYKEASGTSGATPKLYKSVNMAKSAGGRYYSDGEVVEVKLLFGEVFKTSD